MDNNLQFWNRIQDELQQQQEMLRADKEFNEWLDHMNKQSENGLKNMNDSQTLDMSKLQEHKT